MGIGMLYAGGMLSVEVANSAFAWFSPYLFFADGSGAAKREEPSPACVSQCDPFNSVFFTFPDFIYEGGRPVGSVGYASAASPFGPSLAPSGFPSGSCRPHAAHTPPPGTLSSGTTTAATRRSSSHAPLLPPSTAGLRCQTPPTTTCCSKCSSAAHPSRSTSPLTSAEITIHLVSLYLGDFYL